MIERSEILRKSIHFLGLLYIPGILILGKSLMTFVVLTLTVLSLGVEFLRVRYEVIPEELLREYERKRVGAYIYTGLAFSLITPFFPNDACVIAAVCAFAGDGLSGLAKKFDAKLSFLAYFSSTAILAIFLNLQLPASLSAILISYLFDGRKILNDNFTIPTSAAVIYYLLSAT